MEPKNYKLKLRLDLYPSPPSDSTTCVVCKEQPSGPVYHLMVDNPYLNSLIFDETCLEQILAIGFKYYLEVTVPQSEEPKN